MSGSSAASVPLPRKSSTVPGPVLVPKKKTIARSVYLERSLWEALAEAAEFYTATYAAQAEMAGDKEEPPKMSRNEVIETFLAWALESFWADRGGHPTTKAEWEQKARRFAEAAKKNAPK